jgi:hypothetical protein
VTNRNRTRGETVAMHQVTQVPCGTPPSQANAHKHHDQAAMVLLETLVHAWLRRDWLWHAYRTCRVDRRDTRYLDDRSQIRRICDVLRLYRQCHRGVLLVVRGHGSARGLRCRPETLRPVFAELAGMSTRAAAAELDRRGIGPLSGAKWSAMAVLRVRERLARSSAG